MSFAFEKEKGHKKTAKSFAAVAKTNDREADFVKRKNRIVYFVAASAFSFVRFLDDEER